MMRWLLLGALLGLLVVFPPLLALVTGLVAALCSHPVFVAFACGVVFLPSLRTVRRWA